MQRLDQDLADMQEYVVGGDVEAAAQPDELAACQVTAGSEWILAKVLEHDPKRGIFQLVDEDVESHKSKLWLPLVNL